MSRRATGERAAAGAREPLPHTPREKRYAVFGPDVPERNRVLLGLGERLRGLRAAACLSQETLAVRCFMRRSQVSALECGTGTLDLPGLLVVAERLGVSAGMLIEGLQAPVRRVGTAQVLDLVTRQPGATPEVLAASLGLPYSYAYEIALYLQSVGAIASERTGWQPTALTRLGKGAGV